MQILETASFHTEPNTRCRTVVQSGCSVVSNDFEQEIYKLSANHYECTMFSFEISCTGLNATQLSSKDLKATIYKQDISSLNITQSHIPIIFQGMFQNFENVQSLYVTSSGVSSVEDNAFALLSSSLQYLSLNNNNLTTLNLCQTISMYDQLKVLNLSFNRLKDLSSFNISCFPKLEILNVRDNLLTHLPKDILEFLQEDNDFYIIVDNNPWNCSHSDWSEYMNEKLIDSFCTNKTYIPYHIPYNSNIVPEELKSFSDNCYKCSFYYCLFWMGGGVWIGIIIGNISIIKKLLCRKRVEYNDEYTQCERSLVEHHMITGVYDVNRQKFIPVSAIGTTG
ncbi:hypothetical protein ABEB36_007261 [Hypothenemus hampei]|uniref:Uncharacterized protein n=1 Tax=Hypothenemus hampei TaxID=57062 RepID=A0ABD1ETY6_HYPHA